MDNGNAKIPWWVYLAMILGLMAVIAWVASHPS